MNQFENLNIIQRDAIEVSILMESPIKPEAILGDVGLDNQITGKHIHRPQLGLAGFSQFINFKNVQLFGNTEIYYLKSLSEEERIKAFHNVVDLNVPVIIITNNHEIDDELIDIAREKNIALLRTNFPTTKAIALLSDFLDDQFVQQASVHGSFVDVYGVGILFTGRSGIGKSEIALDLVERGHRLVSDDVVMLNKKGDSVLMGTGTSLVQHFMEIRGLGIIDVRQMFGIRSIRFQKRLEIIVELEEWKDDNEYTRTGLDHTPFNVLDVEISHIKLPIFPGKNVTVIAEVIALNYLLKTYGYDAAEVFAEKLAEKIRNKGREDRIINYLQGDIE